MKTRFLFSVLCVSLLVLSSCDMVTNPTMPASTKYLITYDGNGSTGGKVPKDATPYAPGDEGIVLGNTNSLTKDFYTFAGWNTLANGTGTSYAAGSTLTIASSNIKLYAQWTSPLIPFVGTWVLSSSSAGTTSTNTWTITPTSITTATEVSGGSAGTSSKMFGLAATINSTSSTADVVLEIESSSVAGIFSSQAQAVGTFAHFTLSINGSTLTTSSDSGASVSIEAAKLTTVSTPSDFTKQSLTGTTYTVVYDGNGSTGGSVPSDSTLYLSGAPVTVLGNTGSLTKSGFSFTGWSDGTTTYSAGLTFLIATANVTLQAQWSPRYLVTYDGNGSTGGGVPSDTTQYADNAIVTVLGNTGNLTKNGFRFTGWSDGTTTYSAGHTFAIASAHVTLQAQWVVDTALTPFVGTWVSTSTSSGTTTVVTAVITSNGMTYSADQTGAMTGNAVYEFSLASTTGSTPAACDVIFVFDSFVGSGSQASSTNNTGKFARMVLGINGSTMSLAGGTAVATAEAAAATTLYSPTFFTKQ